MSWIDIAIPGVAGLILIIWPASMFFGARVSPDETKILRLRKFGVALLLIAAVFLLIKIVR